MNTEDFFNDLFGIGSLQPGTLVRVKDAGIKSKWTGSVGVVIKDDGFAQMQTTDVIEQPTFIRSIRVLIDVGIVTIKPEHLERVET